MKLFSGVLMAVGLLLGAVILLSTTTSIQSMESLIPIIGFYIAGRMFGNFAANSVFNKRKPMVAVLNSDGIITHINKDQVFGTRMFIEKSIVSNKFNVGYKNKGFKDFNTYDEAVEYLKIINK